MDKSQLLSLNTEEQRMTYDGCATWWETAIPIHLSGFHLCALSVNHDDGHVCDCGSEYAA